MTIRNHITRIRELRKVWTKNLSKKINKSESSIIRYEKWISNMSEATVMAILNYFYVTFWDVTTITVTDKVEIETKNHLWKKI